MEYKRLYIFIFGFILLIGCLNDPQGGGGHVITPLPYSITFDITSLAIDVYEQIDLSDYVRASESIKEISWSSSEAGIATVDDTGILTGISPGSTKITVSVKLATDPEFKQTFQGTVYVKLNNLVENVPIEVNNSLTSTRRYYIDTATDCKYEITWQGNIDVSLYESDGITPVVTEEILPGNIKIHTDECKKIYIHVAAEKGSSFKLVYSIDRDYIPQTWTLLVYMCNTFLDTENLDSLKKMINSFHANIHINFVILLDRESVDDYGPFEDIFYDTRLFVMQHSGLTGQLHRINGAPQFPGITAISDDYEANMGDPATLARFIVYGKKNYPAQYFGLIFTSHGYGVGGFSEDQTNNNDLLHVGEINDPGNPNALINPPSSQMDAPPGADYSVNMLLFNNCYMGGIETAYQFRKSADNTGFYADYMLAAPTTIHITSFSYDTIFQRISLTGGSIIGDKEEITGGTVDEKIYDPRTMSPEELGRVVLEEERDSMFAIDEEWARNEVLSLYNLSFVDQVKAAVDALAVSLYEDYKDDENVKTNLEALRDDDTKVNPHYYKPVDLQTWEYKVIEFPFYELYDLCYGIVNGDFSDNSKAKATQVITNFSNMLVYSYYGEATDNTKGISLFIPHGDYTFQTGRFIGQKMFQHQWWYNALYTGNISPTYLLTQQYYGKLAWCAKGATPGDGVVSNYFELLDAWYDKGDADQGGWNHYKY